MDRPWRSMCTLSISNGMPPSSSSAPPEAMWSPTTARDQPRKDPGDMDQQIVHSSKTHKGKNVKGKYCSVKVFSKTFKLAASAARLVTLHWNAPFHTLTLPQKHTSRRKQSHANTQTKGSKRRNNRSVWKEPVPRASVGSRQVQVMQIYKKRWPAHKCSTYLQKGCSH